MITIKTFVFNSFQVNSFVLHDETKEAIIIDPACENSQEYDELIDYIAENKLVPIAVVNTHAHIDHILGVETIKNKFKIPFKLHKEDEFLVENAPQSAMMFGFEFASIPLIEEYIDEGTVIKFGHSELIPYHVPGHSPGSLVFFGAKDKFIIAGDVLFKGSIGRTDLPGGDYETLITGIKSKLLTLPSDTSVYPGHGPATSIGQEHDTNPFLI
ncbi:MAG TPA: MBL fold hydrolase [Bacteroidales bacterium]|jgi:hydroxyacylglutathione hydrolase|nr:MBL fold hydrolase [Bacteroidales bacterium]